MDSETEFLSRTQFSAAKTINQLGNYNVIIPDTHTHIHGRNTYPE